MAGGGYWLARHPKELVYPPKLTKLAVLPPDGFALEGAASRQSFALSPNGARLAFTAMDSSGEFSVFLRDFNSLEPRLVPGSEGAIRFSGHPTAGLYIWSQRASFSGRQSRVTVTFFWPIRRRSFFPEPG
jgi:hypothetical protein